MNTSSLIDICNHYKNQFGILQLDLGCGMYCTPGHIGVDNLIGSDIQRGDNGPDYIHDLTYPLPIPDAYVDRVYSSHFLEHSRLDLIIPEIARILKPGGQFVNRIPWAASAEDMYPGHNIFLTDKWFIESPVVARYFTILNTSFVPSNEYLSLPSSVKSKFPFDFAKTFFFQACKEFTISLSRI